MTLAPTARPTFPVPPQTPRPVLVPGDPRTGQGNNAPPEAAAPSAADRWDFATGLGRAALAWHRPHLTQQQVVQAITDTAVTLLAGAVGAAVLTRQGTGRLQLTASAGAIPPRVEALRMDGGDQPIPHQVVPRRPAGPAVASRERSGWPVATTTAGRGRTALTYVPLGSGKVMFGTLLINADTPATELTETCAVTLAMHACTAIAAAQQRDRLRSAVDTRDVIGQATGILMERRRTTPDAALAELARTAKLTNTNLRDLCSYLCATGALPALRTGPGAR